MNDDLEGCIIASCGHVLTDDDGPDGMGLMARTIGDDCDHEGIFRTVTYGTVCKKCHDKMAADGSLVTEAEGDAWIRDGVVPQRQKGTQ